VRHPRQLLEVGHVPLDEEGVVVIAVCAIAAVSIAGSLACASAAAGTQTLPFDLDSTIDNGATPFAGDTLRATTLSPNGDGFRDTAYVRVHLTAPATLRLEVRSGQPTSKLVFVRIARLRAGPHTLRWTPARTSATGTYRLVVATRGAKSVLLARVQGIDGAFASSTYSPGSHAAFVVRTDARVCSAQVFSVGREAARTRSARTLNGLPVSRSFRLAPCGSAAGPLEHHLAIGPWRSGFYFVRLGSQDGRVGFVPFIVRPAHLGVHRVAVVEPTFTWQAYNYRDDEVDGRGDTWYADWSRHTATLARPFLDRGVPPYFRLYDLPFIHWLARHHREVDFLADEDLDRVRNGDALTRAYDLIVFPGHHEYVTTHEYDVVERFRDLGGHLMFLSADNFFWRVDRRRNTLHRVAQWRDLGRPEAELVGVQYRGNDEGQRRKPYVVVDAPPWLTRQTGLAAGSAFGRFGIEIDARTAASPPGTRVVARIPALYGPGFDAEMTYYETASGAKVFAAGAFTVAGSAGRPEIDALLTNLWNRLGMGGR
jgi:hypothetical protein